MNFLGTIFASALAASSLFSISATEAAPLSSALRGFKHELTNRGAVAPLAYQLYCLKNRSDCKGGGPSKAVLTSKLMKEISSVNASVNRSMRFDSDKGDRWQSGGKAGDCEDFALTKRKMLIRMGVPAGALRMAVVRNSRGQGHAVLVVKTNKGEMVLDNARKDIRKRNATGYRFLSIASADPRYWTRF